MFFSILVELTGKGIQIHHDNDPLHLVWCRVTEAAAGASPRPARPFANLASCWASLPQGGAGSLHLRHLRFMLGKLAPDGDASSRHPRHLRLMLGKLAPW